MKKLLLFVSLFCLEFEAYAELPINTAIIKKATVFIYSAGASGDVDATKPDGTGVLANVPRLDHAGNYLLLLTARHVVSPSWLGCPTTDPHRIYLRLNLLNYDPNKNDKGVDFIPLDLIDPSGKQLYATSADAQVDGVVVGVPASSFSNKQFDVAFLPISDVATDDEMSKLNIGDSILSAGLVPGAQGQRRNYPIFKFGSISALVDEPFYTGCFGSPAATTPEKVWFLSINLFFGASGSPIFYIPPGTAGVRFGAALSRPMLVGIQSSSMIQADVACMTPIGLIFPIIESLQLPDADLKRGAPTKP